VIQREGNFDIRTEHNHPGNVGASNAIKIISKIKKEAAANLFTAAPAIVNQVLLNEMPDGPCLTLPNPENLARAANHLRKNLHPQIQPTSPLIWNKNMSQMVSFARTSRLVLLITFSLFENLTGGTCV
jgi:hypothetical protein